MNIIAKIAIGGGALLVVGGIIWAACKIANKGEKKNNDNEQSPKPEDKPAASTAAPEKPAEQPAPAAAPAAPEAPAPEAGKTDEKK